MADKDIKLYNFSEIDAAFDSVANEDKLPAFDIIVKMKPKILAYLNAGHSIAWVVSALQRSGLDLKSRQIRTYLARAGIDGNTIKRAHGGTKQRTTRKPKATDGAQAQDGAVQTANAGAGVQAGIAPAESVQNPCSERDAVHAQDVQPSGQDDDGQAVAGMEDTSATGVQSASADVQAVSDNAGEPSAVQTPRARKAGRHGAGTGAGGEPANGVHPSIPGFGPASEDNDDDLL
ncbi:MAG: hypothetical protein K6E40_17620 [Desulfovibrio sp.]|nr:hypothetical protein [Desulfovibrio sp.]